MTELRTAPVQDGHLAYLDSGSGPVLVLLHGGALDHRMWSRQTDEFTAAGHRVIAPDARGHGDSSTPTAPFRHCDDVATLLRHLDTGPVVLVGLSMGAGTAVDVAVEHPDLVAALVVSGTGTSQPAWRDPWILDWFATWQRQAQDGDAAGWLETFLQLGNGPHRTLADVDPRVVADLREQGGKTLATHVGDGNPVLPASVPDSWQRSRGLTVPVLAVIGAADADDHIRMTRELVESAVDGRSVVLADTAHYPNMERPDEFNRAVLDFAGALAQPRVR